MGKPKVESVWRSLIEVCRGCSERFESCPPDYPEFCPECEKSLVGPVST